MLSAGQFQCLRRVQEILKITPSLQQNIFFRSMLLGLISLAQHISNGITTQYCRLDPCQSLTTLQQAGDRQSMDPGYLGLIAHQHGGEQDALREPMRIIHLPSCQACDDLRPVAWLKPALVTQASKTGHFRNVAASCGHPRAFWCSSHLLVRAGRQRRGCCAQSGAPAAPCSRSDQGKQVPWQVSH